MKKDSKTEGETIEQPSMEKVCYLLYKNGGKMDSAEFGKGLGLPPEIVLGYMNIMADLNKYPIETDEDEETISLSPDGERIYRIAELLVDRFRDDYDKLADAAMRFMICGALSDKDRRQKGWDIDNYGAYSINTIGVFLGEKEKPKYIEAFGEKWSMLNAIYNHINPDGWNKFIEEKKKKSK